jgi:hypothetical protein
LFCAFFLEAPPLRLFWYKLNPNLITICIG